MGVECVVVDDRAWEDVLIERTYDWFAQDEQGSVVLRGGHQGVREAGR